MQLELPAAAAPARIEQADGCIDALHAVAALSRGPADDDGDDVGNDVGDDDGDDDDGGSDDDDEEVAGLPQPTVSCLGPFFVGRHRPF